jgi:radical SAM protein with 4Fe4S-binding SPASM domain
MNLSLHENLFRGSAGNERSPQEAPPDSEAAYHQLSCGRCRNFPYLLPDGRLLPCWGFTGSVLEPEMPLLTQTTLAEVYGASVGAFQELVNIRKDEVLACNAECTDCAYRSGCCGGCRADSILNGNGLMGRGAFICSFLKKDYPASLKAIAGV